MRDGEGRTLSEFVDEPSGGLKLVRDFVYGVGQLLVERQVTSAPPQMLLGSPLVSGGSYHLTVTDGSAAPSYELDIRTASGFQNRLLGLQLDAAQQVHVPESALSPGETNVLRLRAEGEPGTGYSVPVSLLYDPSVTPSSPNQIRSLGVSRNGTDLVLRWALLTENGKQTKVSFRRADTGATYVLTPQALASSIKSYTLSSQALASPCGDFLLSQVLQTNETGPTPPLRNPSSQSGTQGTEIDPCDDPPPDPTLGPRFTNAYHHRDHLGTLRNVTGDGGYLAAAYDWYPYGTRMRTGLADSASDSRRVFTGHERDLATGLDYMMARYYGPSLARFQSADPGDDMDAQVPQSWNKYAYVQNNPLKFLDPNGEETVLHTRVSTYPVSGNTAAEAFRNAAAANPDGFSGHTTWSIEITSLDTMEAGSAELGSAVSIPTDVTVTVTATVSVPAWTAPAGTAPGEQQAFDTAKAGLEKHEQSHVEIAKQGGQAIEKKVMNSVGTGKGPTQGQAKADAKADLVRKAERAQRQERTTTSKKQKDYDKKTEHGRQP